MRCGYLTLLLLAVTIGACTKSRKPADYARWITDPANGLYQEKQLGDLAFTVQLKPAPYIALLESRGAAPDAAQIEKRTQELQPYYHVDVNILTNKGKSSVFEGTTDPAAYGSLVNYFSNEAQQDFRLVAGTDTLNCALYHFERTYELVPQNTINLVFQRPDHFTGDLQLIYTDRRLHTGDIRFTFPERTLTQLPKLVF